MKPWGGAEFCILDFQDEGRLHVSVTCHTASSERLYSCHATVAEALLDSISQARCVSHYEQGTLWVSVEELGLI